MTATVAMAMFAFLPSKLVAQDARRSPMPSVCEQMSKQKVMQMALPRSYRQTNIEAAHAVGITQLWAGGVAGLALSGSGQTIGLWDADSPLTTHSEYDRRLSYVDSEAENTIDNHATKMAGTMIAAGNTPKAKGTGSIPVELRPITGIMTLRRCVTPRSAPGWHYRFILMRHRRAGLKIIIIEAGGPGYLIRS
ncbi:MAG: hypothetical protein U5J63_18535 [Fodinibius sp.]|nr:hypothetical protein [Fodinibius sp.]